ncbi:MAG: ribonucleotide reductase subunit alpha [Piscirickettsiaceae bacterium]|nr:ribonucleotide reductase subunit alpha [Piscirickettsiaceae bacterium]
MVDIINYETLLMVGREQQEAQRFLFTFLKSSLPKDHEGNEEQSFQAGKGGVLQPLMCVDKALGDLTTFADLFEESKNMEQDWQIVLVACLSGVGESMPAATEIDLQLKMMVQMVENGGDLSRYLAFDRAGDLIQFA